MRIFVRQCFVIKRGRSCLQQLRQIHMRGALPLDEHTHVDSVELSQSKSICKVVDNLDVLPPWPVDEIEFNTQVPGGGHDARRAHEKHSGHVLCDDDETICKDFTDRGALLQPQLPTEDQRREISRMEKTKEGIRALDAGGWVCGLCFRCMPHRSRSVCDFCHTIRHDAERAVARWRNEPSTWFCSHCREFNFARDVACRCCSVRRDGQMELHVVQHERVLDEIQRAPVGSVIVTRNRLTRWRCIACNESNALQSSVCRHCSKERFDFTAYCPTCKAPQNLSNKKLYGSDPADHIHVARPFGLHNCFPRLAPELRCSQCKSSLHGATASSRSDAWLCGCGVVSNPATVSCPRCRFPRRLPQTAVLEELLRVWDFAGTTNWYCEGCNYINKASRHVVALERNGSPPLVDGQRPTKGSNVCRGVRTVHGFSRCEECGLQWHHQALNNGQHWRCACLKVNHRDDTRCQVCQLPAVDGIRSDVLSFWSRGDWYCLKCHRQNYREKLACACGESRPKG